jgi:hypothetical protein
MARPKGGYWKIDPTTGKKKRMPGVTTVLNQLGWGRDGLLYWANSQGLEGLTLEDARQTPLGVGNVVHAMIEADLHKLPHPDIRKLDKPDQEMAVNAFAAWQDWAARNELTPVKVEHELISKAYDYAGTIDAVTIQGARSLIDFKTANALYSKDLVQIAAYGRLWEEHHPDEPIERYHLLRLSKRDGSFHHSSWPARATAIPWQVFLRCLDLNRFEKQLKDAM